ncbi:nucleotidyltransferase family protein [Microbulbifer litoralis]|uniref:nucleotidyltransferase family protein n=1 Tax=Microbulbifer litoralis TaxID=2933965 RepID=UPI0020294A18|nr:nucleotidyltransferase family protein [Microbulbifer sp. GX H0434]
MDSIQPIILAAGASRRFGDCKLLLRRNGKTLLQQCIDKLSSLALPAPLIITGAWHRELVAAHPHLDLRENRDWQSGMGSSLAFAVRQLQSDCDAALVLLADQVAIDETDIRQLISSRDRRADDVVCSFYAGRRGAPAIFPRRIFPQLMALRGDRGARDLLRNPHETITTVPLANGAIDIDTTEDWEAYQRR